MSDNSAECVVCLSDVRDTLILPCRHLCLCNTCADTLRYQANNCPICRLRKGRGGWHLPSSGFWVPPAPRAAMLCSAGMPLLGNGVVFGGGVSPFGTQVSSRPSSPLLQLSEPCFKSEP